MDREVEEMFAQANLYPNTINALKLGLEFYFDLEDGGLLEVCPYDSEPTDEEVAGWRLPPITVPWDCSGQAFTMYVRKVYSKHLKKWLILHRSGIDL